MPYNGSGGVTQPANSIYPATGNTLIESAKANASIADIYSMLTGVITKDGQTTVTANLPMAGFKLTGLGAGTAAGHSVRYEQVYTTQALTDAATISWAATAPVATVTLGGSRTMAAPSGLLAGGLYTLIVTQDGTGGRTLTWNAVFKGQGGGVMPQPEGTAAAVTQFNFISDGTNLFSLQCTPFMDTNYIVRGATDPTKKVRLEVDGLTTATTRVMTVPNSDGTISYVAGFDRVQRTSANVTTTSTSLVDLTGATVTLTTGANPVLVGQACQSSNSGGDGFCYFNIDIDGTLQMGTTGIGLQTYSATASSNSSFSFLTAALTAASHTIKMQWRVSAGTGTVFASAATAHTFFVAEVR